MTGQPARFVTGNGWVQRIHPDNLGMAMHEWQQARLHGMPIDVEIQMQMPNSKYHWHQARAAPQVNPDRSIAKWHGTIEDI